VEKKYAERGLSQMKIWRMRIHAGYLGLQTNSQVVNCLFLSIATMVARTHLNVTLHVHCLSGYWSIHAINCHINHLKTKRRTLYLKTESVPRCKHFSSRL